MSVAAYEKEKKEKRNKRQTMSADHECKTLEPQNGLPAHPHETSQTRIICQDKMKYHMNQMTVRAKSKHDC